MSDHPTLPVPPGSTGCRELLRVIRDALTLPPPSDVADEVLYLRLARDRDRAVLDVIGPVLASPDAGQAGLSAAAVTLRRAIVSVMTNVAAVGLADLSPADMHVSGMTQEEASALFELRCRWQDVYVVTWIAGVWLAVRREFNGHQMPDTCMLRAGSATELRTAMQDDLERWVNGTDHPEPRPRTDGSVPVTGLLPDGAAIVAAADLATVLAALSEAAEWRVNGDPCGGCQHSPSGRCPEHAADATAEAAYRDLAARLGAPRRG